MFRTTADYNYILKLQINTSKFFVICINFILLHRRKASPSVRLKCIKGYKRFLYGSNTRIYKPENKRKFTEPERERMSDDVRELNDTELNHIHFGDKTDSDNASNDSDEDFVAKKPISF